MLGTRADSAPLCCLHQRENVKCESSTVPVFPGMKGLWEAELSMLKPGMSQTSWGKLATLDLTLNNLLRCLCQELFLGKQALPL